MHTIKLQVNDNKLEAFLNLVDNLKDGIVENIVIQSDSLDKETKNYMQTEQFQNDKAYFQKSLADIESGKTKCLSQNEYELSMNKFTEELKSKYANN